MADQDEQRFLHTCGSQLRERLADASVTGADDLRRIARSSILDLLGSRQHYVSPITDVLDQLLAADGSSGIVEASLAAIGQQLRLTYNEHTTDLVLGFARGFLALERPPASVSASVAEPPMGPPPQPSASRPSPVLASLAAAPGGLVMFNQWLMLLALLGGLGVITLLAVRLLHSPAPGPSQAAPPPGSAAAPIPGPARPMPATGSAAAPPAPAQTPLSAASGSSSEDMGVAAAGQRVLLDAASVAPSADPSRVSFRYWLGSQLIASQADCSRQTWTTDPEGETHTPQSPATARLLARVCQAASPAPPLPSSASGASSAGMAMVFDPPSNIRVTPNGVILCSVTTRQTIPIQAREGDWYRTDVCGSPGYIHKGQVSF